MNDSTYPEEDARDRRAALAFAGALANAREGSAGGWEQDAKAAYRWLQGRDTLRAASVQVTPGIPRQEGSTVTATFTLSDTDEVTFSLTGLDAKGAEVPLPAGFTAAWSLADPDASGAVLTPSADTLTAVLAGGVPDTSLMVSVAVTQPDGTVLHGAEAVVVQATPAATVGLVAGTPVPETA